MLNGELANASGRDKHTLLPLGGLNIECNEGRCLDLGFIVRHRLILIVELQLDDSRFHACLIAHADCGHEQRGQYQHDKQLENIAHESPFRV